MGVPQLVRLACCGKGAAVLLLTSMLPMLLVAEASDKHPLSELKRLSKSARKGLTPTDAYNIGIELARPLSTDATVVQAIGQQLANEQMDWQSRHKRGIDEAKLLKALNRNLDLDKAPEYLQIRLYELRRIRVLMWAQLPELSTGLDRAEAKKGSRVINEELSPFEAFLVSGMVVYQKLFNDQYLRTSEEDRQKASAIEQQRSPGLYQVPPIPAERNSGEG